MLITRRKTSVEQFKREHQFMSIKTLAIKYAIPYKFLNKDDENKMILFILKVLKYRKTGYSKDQEVIEANKYYTSYFL